MVELMLLSRQKAAPQLRKSAMERSLEYRALTPIKSVSARYTRLKSACAILEIEAPRAGIFVRMTLLNKEIWEVAAAVTSLVALSGVVVWLKFRRRLTPDEIEAGRRKFLAQSGRLVDGMLLDVCDVPAEDGRTLKMLFFSYRIGGVDYECSQDITVMGTVVNPEQVRPGFPCSVCYQPGNPQNSIVVAEGWTGLREGLPQYPAFEEPEPIDMRHLRRRAK